ncbi:hypothetical protein RHMOL_Rhmol05G0131500 [Rhododendron molle]|uniref:Uncharacterized protein n=1 Tax=Rhododendron molle TaxID=49168 RepID=A0ACC0NNL4_RHOML|nr:hypothetical protein RHMOL_Rhmol05G0131500 [Rhododendron molle]
MSYSGRTIYEWNIDGMTEYQIFGVVHQMMMYSTICSQNNNSGREIATWITAGFTGMIKGWWDNILSAIQRVEILTAIKIENNEQKDDAVYTLVQAIILHFIGHWDNQREQSRELLQNLKCPTLTHFRWYKDVFLAKVMQRTDANSEHWKSKFVDGLPYFFAEEIRKKLRDQNNGTTIIYDNYTYGQLVSIIIQEGLTLCNDIKLHNQLKKQNLTGKQELGQFCDQFGYDLTQYPKPARKNSKADKTTRKYSKRKSSKKNKKIEPSDSKESTSKKHKKPKKTSDESKKATAKCFKCGKIGHYANKCKTKKKLNELQIDEGLRQQLFKLLLESSEESSDEETEDQVNDLSDHDEESSSTEEEAPCNCNNLEFSTSDNYWKAIVEMNGLSINVLTDKQQGLLDIIDQIEDPQLRIKIIETCIASNTKEEEETKPRILNETYSLKTVLDRLEQIGSDKPATIPDLKGEINTLKTEIKLLKSFQTRATQEIQDMNQRMISLEKKGSIVLEDDSKYLNLINNVVYQKWHVKLNLVIHKEYTINNIVALVDSGADMNCIQEAPKMKLFQTKVRFLGHNIHQGKIFPIDRSIEFASKFPDELRERTQLQRFLGSLNYIGDYYKDLAQDSAPLYERLRKNPPPWTERHTMAVKKIKLKEKELPCLAIANPDWKKIVETDASNIGYGCILKQYNPNTSKEELVRFTSGLFKNAQANYSTIKKEILSIIKCINKFQDDLLNQ